MGFVVAAFETHKKRLHLSTVGQAAVEADDLAFQLGDPHLKTLAHFPFQARHVFRLQAAQTERRAPINVYVQLMQPISMRVNALKVKRLERQGFRELQDALHLGPSFGPHARRVPFPRVVLAQIHTHHRIKFQIHPTRTPARLARELGAVGPSLCDGLVLDNPSPRRLGTRHTRQGHQLVQAGHAIHAFRKAAGMGPTRQRRANHPNRKRQATFAVKPRLGAAKQGIAFQEIVDALADGLAVF